MNVIHLKTTNLNNMFQDLQNHFGGDITSKSDEKVLTLNNEKGEGLIRGITFKGSITYIEFDIVFKNDILLVNRVLNSSPIYFAYCSKGHLVHSFGVEGDKTKLEQFQTGIVTTNSDDDNVFHFKKDLHYKISTIVVSTDAKSLSYHKLNAKLKETFFSKKENGHFLYTGSYNLRIADKIQQLNAITQKGIVRSLLIEAIVHMILALEIQQHTDDLVSLESNRGSLSNRELEDVREISDFIKNYPEIQYTLKYLSNKSGLSPAKLQEGFKLMHERTVTDFIRNVRVEAAEHLIKTTDLNISEVVYTVGLTSRSYFSKIFKEKYNCSPKQYQDHQNTLAITA
ncbi:AraC family transcriptional regulator [Flavobacteriaceae bacterium KMM 6897]|nr:AraC family transcriptional regulator [Flavobacteriaceae bacterium KMM 6897]MEB8345224.1 AraC family transcriptional regulator [Flavobacteriaceae bacterium KMM 6898]